MSAVAIVPTIVARGMVRSAFSTDSAGIVAASRPRNAKSVSVITVISADPNAPTVCPSPRGVIGSGIAKRDASK
jgi:hypothetical protein